MTLTATCIAAWLFVGQAAPIPSAAQRFTEAQEKFDAARATLVAPDADIVESRKKFYQAARQFAGIARDGVASVNLYVNTANAYHFAGDDARALLWYLRANQLANTAETRNGLAALRHACDAQPWPPDHGSVGRALMFWHYDLSRSAKQWILLATYPLGFLLLLTAVFINRRYICTRLGIALIIVGATIGISDMVATAENDGQWAVVLESGKGFAGDGEGYSTVVDRIKPGQEVRLIESRDDWLRVELPSGTRCWLRADICEVV